MATINPTVEVIRANLVAVTWVLGDGDDGRPYEFAYLPDRTVHTFGTFGAGGRLEWQGSNEPPAAPTQWCVLKNFNNRDLSHNALACGLVAENTRLVRPVVVAGTGNTLTAIAVGFTTTPGVSIGGVPT